MSHSLKAHYLKSQIYHFQSIGVLAHLIKKSSCCLGLLGGLWPLWRLSAYFCQYHHQICQLEYMLFDTKHVEIGPKMAEIVQIAWKLREICVKLHEEVREIAWKYHRQISRLEYMLFDTQHVEIGPKMAEIAQIAWKLREIAWRGAWNCVNVSLMDFSAWVHAFWYATCWNWPKNGWNSPNCVKIAWNCVK